MVSLKRKYETHIEAVKENYPREYEILNIALEDDETEHGGISYEDEVLHEFLDEADLPYTIIFERAELNLILKECGIKQLEYTI